MKSQSRRSLTRAFLPTALACALVLATGPASADESARADASFQEGRAALAKGNLLEACTKFGESDRIEPSGRAVLNLADCLERRGMIAGAYAKFLEAAARALQANRLDAERHARDRAARLEPRLGRIVVVVPKDSEVPGLEIRKDGVRLAQSQWNVAEIADPGTTHTYEASAPGRAPWVMTLTISEGRVARAELRWSETPAAATSPAAAPVSQSRGASSSQPSQDGSRALAYGALGVGAAGLIVGTIGGISVLSSKSTVDAHCNPTTRACDQEGLDAAAAGRTWSVVSPVGFIVGALGIGAGAYLLVRGSADRRGAVAVRPLVSPEGGGLMLGGSL